jgi:hypothetical protein
MLAATPSTIGASGDVIIPSPKVFVRGIFARRATVVCSPTATDERIALGLVTWQIELEGRAEGPP